MRLASILLLATLCLAGCYDATYTFYRNSVLDENARYHVATFDAAEAKNTTKKIAQLLKSYFKSSQEFRRGQLMGAARDRLGEWIALIFG